MRPVKSHGIPDCRHVCKFQSRSNVHPSTSSLIVEQVQDYPLQGALFYPHYHSAPNSEVDNHLGQPPLTNIPHLALILILHHIHHSPTKYHHRSLWPSVLLSHFRISPTG